MGALAGAGTSMGTSLPGDDRRGAAFPHGVAVALLAGGVGVGVASFLPAYLGGVPLASQAYNAIAHALPLTGLALAAVLVVLAGGSVSSAAASPKGAPVPSPGSRGARRDLLAVGGALGVGVASLELGLVLTDIGQAVAGAQAGPGLVLAAVAWALCAAGSVIALSQARRHELTGRPARRGKDVGIALVLAAAGLGVAGLFGPAWDRYVVDLVKVGRVTVFTAGDAFAQPGTMIAGSAVVMVAVVAAALVAGFVRRAAVAGGLLGGALIVLVGQVISALVQWRTPLPVSDLGLTPGRAASLGVQVNAGFTAAFYGFCAFVALLAVIGAARVAAIARPGARPASPPRSSPPVTWAPPLSPADPWVPPLPADPRAPSPAGAPPPPADPWAPSRPPEGRGGFRPTPHY